MPGQNFLPTAKLSLSRQNYFANGKTFSRQNYLPTATLRILYKHTFERTYLHRNVQRHLRIKGNRVNFKIQETAGTPEHIFEWGLWMNCKPI